jgi:bacterioferritin-associated ferredoxin
MYICVCHAVTEDDVRGHVASGAASPKAVRAACGMRPGCGSCVKRICALLAESATSHPPVMEQAPAASAA